MKLLVTFEASREPLLTKLAVSNAIAAPEWNFRRLLSDYHRTFQEWKAHMNHEAVNALCEYVNTLSSICVANSQKIDAVERLMKRRTDFAQAYRRELEITKARGQQSAVMSDMCKLQELLSR